MKIIDLVQKLEAKQVPKHLYQVGNYGITDQKLCLKNENNRWIVFYSERGDKLALATFNTEEDACEEFYSRIVSKAKL
ncbi:hypothetical protein [Clostridium lacusfryxellense]|uniref:hypothetical protein n=1 Tax=Clostridium lacusfryxellense TaxID=205328 RepID=UPI001C0C9038|nr:hypothetical protein [Clostridium lacusfryxellense]MBU3112347.1 hypothetical protein [Clostridium lacusfryxellense]